MKFAENPKKVRNIVNSQYELLMHLYCPLFSEINGIFYDPVKDIIERDPNPDITIGLYHQLPYGLKSFLPIPSEIQKIQPNFFQKPLENRIHHLVRRSSILQTLKGIPTAGIGKSILYGGRKVMKRLKK